MVSIIIMALIFTLLWRRKKGLTDEDIKKEIEELNDIIAECDEVIRKHLPVSRTYNQIRK